MSKIQVAASKLQGELTLPPSKSHTLRALLFGMMAKGSSKIYNYLQSPDTDALIKTIQSFGAQVNVTDNMIEIEGTGGEYNKSEEIIDCGNSGIALRFLSAFAALFGCSITITGDHSIRNNRPMKPLINALKLMGVSVISLEKDNFAPLSIQGPIKTYETSVIGSDSQFVSALLILGAFCGKQFEIHVTSPGELPWIELTLSWLKFLNIHYETNGHYTYFKIFGKTTVDGFEYTVPSDLSSAAFPVVAALITNSEITLSGIDLCDVQGDKKLLSILEKMGAQFSSNIEKKTLLVKKGCELKGQNIDMNDFIDALCIMAVVGCFAEGETILYNASIARTKECDRIKAITSELKKLGANIKETKDGLIISSSNLKNARVSSHQDHRIILSLAVAGLGAEGLTTIEDSKAISKTYRSFVTDMSKINANIEEIE